MLFKITSQFVVQDVYSFLPLFESTADGQKFDKCLQLKFIEHSTFKNSGCKTAETVCSF